MILTDAQHKIFRDEFDYWVQYFGLYDWEIVHYMRPEDNCRAYIYTQESAKVCSVYLNQVQVEDVSDKDLRFSAFHEACELLLCLLWYTATMDGIEEESRGKLYNTSRHAVIQRLANSVWKQKELADG